MELELWRFDSEERFTAGVLYLMPRKFLCFTLEDERREQKVPGETRIPSGRYEIKLRTEGGFHLRYAARFRDLHKGMLHLQGVPGFEYILIHCGNSAEDTAGCVLVGDTALPRAAQIGGSEVAYRRIYPMLAAQIQEGGRLWIAVTDFA